MSVTCPDCGATGRHVCPRVGMEVVPPAAKPYTCEKCGKEFEQEDGWTDADALEEMRDNFGDLDEDDKATICDDCYKAFMKWWKPQTN